MTHEYNSLKGLRPEDYQHPGERIAMAAMKKIPLFDIVVKKYLDLVVKFNLYADAVSECARITPKTNPRVYKLYQTALERLDMPEEYPLFCKFEYDYNAYATGGQRFFIVVNSSCVEDYSDCEMLALLGHELGHIKSGHLLYHNMASMLNKILSSLGGLGKGAALALQVAILEWKRNAEYTADRAGLLACADIHAAQLETLKLLGQSAAIEDVDWSIDRILKQADDFAIDIADPIAKAMLVSMMVDTQNPMTHPLSILRLKQITEWHNSGEFEAIIKKYSQKALPQYV